MSIFDSIDIISGSLNLYKDGEAFLSASAIRIMKGVETAGGVKGEALTITTTNPPTSSTGTTIPLLTLDYSDNNESPRVGIGTPSPKSLFQIDSPSTSQESPDIILTVPSESLSVGDETGRISFAIADTAFSSSGVISSGSTAAVYSKVLGTGVNGSYGSLVFEINDNNSITTPIEALTIGYNLGSAADQIGEAGFIFSGSAKFISNLPGTKYITRGGENVAYLGDNLSTPLDFSEGVLELYKDNNLKIKLNAGEQSYIEGNLNISSSLTASGLNYPDADGLDRQIMKTDGNGNLSFGYAENVEISVKNVSGGSIPKGTPCYITASGTSGNAAGIIPSDASDISTMPAGVIAGETLADEAEGVGLINGFIQGVDTSAFTSGDTVYVAVGGGYTNVKPTGSGVYIQKLGNVEKVDNINGSGVINGPGYYNDLPNWETGKIMVGTDTYPVTSSLITLDETNLKLTVEGSGSTIFEVNGSGGQLFSITDSLSGSLFAVSDVSGLPILEVFSDDTVKIGTFNNEAIIVSGSTAIIKGVLSGSGGAQIAADLYEFGYEITTSFPVTGSGLIVSSSNLPANHYNMVKIGETELLDLNTALTPNTFFIHNVDNFIVASGSEPVNVYGDGPGKLFEHTGDEFKIYTGDVNRITVTDSSTNFTHPITTNQISTVATLASSPQYIAVWESLPSGTPAEVKYVTASTFTGGGGGSTTLGGLNDVTITSVTDGDLLRYNGTATEWQNTNLGLSLTPTLSIESDFYFPGSATITNYASYSAPSIFAEVKLDGNVLVPNENISHDGSGNLTWADPSGSLNTGSRVLEVQVQDFGDLASEITTGSYTVSEASFRYIRFETTTASDHTFVREFRVYTGEGQSGTAYPPDMTSDTAPSPYVASSSGAYTSTYAAFKVFDNSPTSTGWWNLAQSPYSGDWVQIDFGSAITFKSIQLIINPTYSGFSVGTIYASNSGSFTGEEITLATFDNSLNTINIG